ncbi:MAG: EamA family transporter [Rhodospirillaceae bacterium]|nr:EamA family transporter [Rhodospirillaceae bacterium]
MAQPRLADYAMLLFLGTAWGSSFLFIGLAVHTMPPLTIAALRCLVAALTLLAVAKALGNAMPRAPRVWVIYALMGLTNSALPFMLISMGQTRIDSSLAAILITTVPLFTLVLAHLFTEDKTTPRRIAGVLLGFCGIVLLVGPSALAGIGADLGGQVLIVAAALCFAITQILVKRFGGGTPLVNAGCSIACSALWTIPLAALVERPWQASPDAIAIVSVLILGLVSTAATHFVFFLLIRRTGPQFATLNNYISPSVGILLGVAILGERPHWTAYLALVVIVAGITVATRRPAMRLTPAAAD